MEAVAQSRNCDGGPIEAGGGEASARLCRESWLRSESSLVRLGELRWNRCVSALALVDRRSVGRGRLGLRPGAIPVSDRGNHRPVSASSG
jgi:hypothetical protein